LSTVLEKQFCLSGNDIEYMYSDETIWKGLMEGDKGMFLALYREYYHCLLFIGLKQFKDADLVKDAIQQQFLYLWEKRTSLQMAHNVRTYLITSFLRRLSDYSKKDKRAAGLRDEDIDQFINTAMTPEENMIAKDGQKYLNQFLMDRINSLPPREKELVILKFYQGLSYNEIVEETGLAHRTVYNKIHEALKALKLNMESENISYNIAISHVLTVILAALLILFKNW